MQRAAKPSLSGTPNQQHSHHAINSWLDMAQLEQTDGESNVSSVHARSHALVFDCQVCESSTLGVVAQLNKALHCLLCALFVNATNPIHHVGTTASPHVCLPCVHLHAAHRWGVLLKCYLASQ